MDKSYGKPTDVKTVLAQFKRPKKAVVTAGMPYANGPLHLGHLAGAQVPADIYARWMRMLIGADNVLFANGTDDHGSSSEVAALQANIPVREFIDNIHKKQQQTLDRYSISVNSYTGTSRPECFPEHKETAQEFLHSLFKNEMLEKRVTQQWYDPKMQRFLQDRFVRGQCPNPKCSNSEAYSDNCEVCDSQYDPTELVNPRSMLSDASPELRETAHWWLDIWKVADPIREWIKTKKKFWRQAVFNEVFNTVIFSLQFENTHEETFKTLKKSLPPFKSRYVAGKKIEVLFESKDELYKGQEILQQNQIPSKIMDKWAHRSITRDVSWGIPVPPELDPEMQGKTLYVWPDSLIAPISFSKVALKERGKNTEKYKEFWCDPDAHILQFLGQDNVFFYVIMQAALWLGSQKNPNQLPQLGDHQMTEVFGCFHLMVDGEKMSKTRGNFFTADQMLDEKGFTADQIRYFLALLSLPVKASNFDFKTFKERNRFLAGPLNAAFEKPISAALSKFNGEVPNGTLNEKAHKETIQMVRRYLGSMKKADYSTLLFSIENYARQINSLFTQFKPHDDRFPEEDRRNALYSCFYILKNLMIMLYPFVPETMNRLRLSLKLDETVFSIDELGVPIPAGHKIGEKTEYFPPASAPIEQTPQTKSGKRFTLKFMTLSG